MEFTKCGKFATLIEYSSNKATFGERTQDAKPYISQSNKFKLNNKHRQHIKELPIYGMWLIKRPHNNLFIMWKKRTEMRSGLTRYA